MYELSQESEEEESIPQRTIRKVKVKAKKAERDQIFGDIPQRQQKHKQQQHGQKRELLGWMRGQECSAKRQMMDRSIGNRQFFNPFLTLLSQDYQNRFKGRALVENSGLSFLGKKLSFQSSRPFAFQSILSAQNQMVRGSNQPKSSDRKRELQMIAGHMGKLFEQVKEEKERRLQQKLQMFLGQDSQSKIKRHFAVYGDEMSESSMGLKGLLLDLAEKNKRAERRMDRIQNSIKLISQRLDVLSVCEDNDFS